MGQKSRRNHKNTKQIATAGKFPFHRFKKLLFRAKVQKYLSKVHSWQRP